VIFVNTFAATLLLLSPTAPSEPVTLEIDALSVAAPVVKVGNTENLGMEIPSDVSNVGWWKHGPAPGETGNAVMVAHVSTRVDEVPTRGVFYDLIDLETGDPVTVSTNNGVVLSFTVTEVVVYPKTELPIDRIFSREGSPGLVLITCGGEFNGETRHFDSNVVVYARMVSLVIPEYRRRALSREFPWGWPIRLRLLLIVPWRSRWNARIRDWTARLKGFDSYEDETTE